MRQLPSSGRAKKPSKSILKNAFSSFVPIAEQPVHGVTPEFAEPTFHQAHYFPSSMSTIIASLQPDINARALLADLTKAYSVLSVHFKMLTVANTDGPIPDAFVPLEEHTDRLVQAFRRDIGRAFVNPRSNHPPHSASPPSLRSARNDGYTEEEIIYARDLCSLCHAAIQCFSAISPNPTLYSVFSDAQLGEILSDILKILIAPYLPTINARRTWTIAIQSLQIQRLPTTVLAPNADRIACGLCRGIDGRLGREGKQGASLESLKAVVTLASYLPAIFLPTFGKILPSILIKLRIQIPTLRVQAAHTLFCLGCALARHPSPSCALLTSFSHTTSVYLKEYFRTHQKSQNYCLPQACQAGLPAPQTQSTAWSRSITATLVIILAVSSSPSFETETAS